MTDTEILELEERLPVWSGRKEVAIRELGSVPAKYFSRLHRLVVQQDVVAAHPQMCARVIRRIENPVRYALSSTPD